MAERLKQNSIEEAGVNPFNAPIPGESLTTSPDNPKAWERPPEHADDDDAMEEIYLLLTEQDKLKELINIINDGTPLDEIAQVVLYKGYTSGKYNPDVMLMLIEPTIYLLIAIADYAEIIFGSNVRLARSFGILGLDKKKLGPQFSQTIGSILYENDKFEVDFLKKSQKISKNTIFSRFSSWLDEYI